MTAEAREIASILLARPTPPLKPSEIYDRSLTSRIEALNDSIPVRSALHLLNDDIDHAHTLAQSDDGNLTSNYLRAQLHRREGDYWNSKVSSTVVLNHILEVTTLTVVAWDWNAIFAPRT